MTLVLAFSLFSHSSEDVCFVFAFSILVAIIFWFL